VREIEFVRWRLGQFMAQREHASNGGFVGQRSSQPSAFSFQIVSLQLWIQLCHRTAVKVDEETSNGHETGLAES
jgi:hypothetical protein